MSEIFNSKCVAKRIVQHRGQPVKVAVADLEALGCPRGLAHRVEQRAAAAVVDAEHRADAARKLKIANELMSSDPDVVRRARAARAADEIDSDSGSTYPLTGDEDDLDENERGLVAAFVRGLRAARIKKSQVS